MGQDKPELKRRTGTETGVIQRVEIGPDAAHEPPQPPTLPEFDFGGITGNMQLKGEGEDAAKQRDDTTSINVSNQ